MVVSGRVQNGVIVVDDGVHLSEGQEVTVFLPSSGNLQGHSVLDIPPVSLGCVLRPLGPDDDLLAEMLEETP